MSDLGALCSGGTAHKSGKHKMRAQGDGLRGLSREYVVWLAKESRGETPQQISQSVLNQLQHVCGVYKVISFTLQLKPVLVLMLSVG